MQSKIKAFIIIYEIFFSVSFLSASVTLCSLIAQDSKKRVT